MINVDNCKSENNSGKIYLIWKLMETIEVAVPCLLMKSPLGCGNKIYHLKFYLIFIIVS